MHRYPKWLCASYRDRLRKGQRFRYQRKPHHKKKEKRDDSWREYKKVRKDKSKCYYANSSMTAGIHGWFKTESNRIERRSVKQQLYKENWDSWQNFQRDYYLDPWGWD